MSRLLFAAARGARIQTRYAYNDTFVRHGEWKTVSVMVFDPVNAAHPHEQRIHPDDAHLQYGPISSALRKEATHPTDTLPSDTYALAWADWTSSEYHSYWVCNDELHRSLFLLILSEALADEGL